MKKRFALLAALVASMLGAFVIGDAAIAHHDRKPSRADGVWCYTPEFDSLTPFAFGADNAYEGDEYPGDKLFMTAFYNSEWTGVFEGESRDYAVLIADPPLEPTSFTETVVFDDVRVKGVEGGLVLDVNGGYDRGQWSGKFTISGGSGDLSEISGSGNWWGPGFDVTSPDECGVIYYRVQKLRGVFQGGR